LFYSIYQVLVKELSRFNGCTLEELGFHTTSDRTSKSSGDIEIIKDNQIMESLEIKFNIEISTHIVNRAISKIIQYNPSRYYILSTLPIVELEKSKIKQKVADLHKNHGCQIIINGIIPTIKYYLRLIDNTSEVLENFTHNIMKDTELKLVHKEQWKRIYESL
jgi:DNA (cytosine-5)-methyltransferase 1